MMPPGVPTPKMELPAVAVDAALQSAQGAPMIVVHAPVMVLA